MFNRRSKQKSTPIVLVTPGDVISAQHLLKVQQNSLNLFFSRSYYSYKFVWLYLVLIATAASSAVWLFISRTDYPTHPAFISLEACISLLAVLELTWRLALTSLCDYIKEPIHWVDFSVIVLWFVGVALVFASTDREYYTLVLGVQVIFTLRTLIPLYLLFKRMHQRTRKDSNTNILNISHLPNEREEVEVIVLDESLHPTQQDHSQRHLQQPMSTPGANSAGFFTADKGDEAGAKLAAEED